MNFCSKNALNSYYVKSEWQAAHAGRKIIIPLFEEIEHVPFLLRPLSGIKINPKKLEKTIEDIHSGILKSISVKYEKKNFKIISFRGTRIIRSEVIALKEIESKISNKKLSEVRETDENMSMCFSVSNFHITGLALKGCGLKTLSKSVSNFKAISRLFLGHNNLIHIPELFGELKDLKELDLNNNLITTLPESIGNLQVLEILKLYNNNIETLPKSIGNLKSLRQLWLQNNNIETLPKSIGNLKSLRQLWLQNNNIKTLPESISNLESLRQLWLQNNIINPFPDSAKILYMQGCKIYRNDKKNINSSIEIREEKERREKWDVLKIALVGRGAVGRTSLINRFSKKVFIENTKITIAVNFETKRLRYRGRRITLLLVDLAGQQRWRFFQEDLLRGLDGAIMTFDLTSPISLENFEDWIKIINSGEKDIPILLVGTKMDLTNDTQLVDDYAKVLQEKYEMRDYIKVSSKTGKNVDLIFQKLIEYAIYRE